MASLNMRHPLLGLMLFCCCLVGRCQAQPDTSWRQRLQNEVRTLGDLRKLDLRQILPSEWWVLAQVKPDPGSPDAMVTGMYFDRKGDPVVTGPVHDIITVFGSLKPLAVMAGPEQVPLRYRYVSGAFLSSATVSMSPILTTSSQKGLGGTAIFRINPIDGDDKFKPVYVVPKAWAGFALPAIQATRADPVLFSPEPDVARLQRLRQILVGSNPFLALAALRTLFEGHLLHAEVLQTALTRSSGIQLSLLMWYLLDQIPTQPKYQPEPNAGLAAILEGQEALAANNKEIENMGRIIDDAPDAPTLLAELLGVYSTPVTKYYDRSRQNVLLRRGLRRYRALGAAGTAGEAGAYLTYLCGILDRGFRLWDAR